jgi:hypothetical protein
MPLLTYTQPAMHPCTRWNRVYSQETPTAAAARAAAGASKRQPHLAGPVQQRPARADGIPSFSTAPKAARARKELPPTVASGAAISSEADRPSGGIKATTLMLGLGRLRSLSIGTVWSLVGSGSSVTACGSSGGSAGGAESQHALPSTLLCADEVGRAGQLQPCPRPERPQQEGAAAQVLQQPARRREGQRLSQGKGSSAISFTVHGPTGKAALLPMPRSLPSRGSPAAADAAALAAAQQGSADVASGGGRYQQALLPGACAQSGGFQPGPGPAAEGSQHDGGVDVKVVQPSAWSCGDSPVHNPACAIAQRLHRLARRSLASSNHSNGNTAGRTLAAAPGNNSPGGGGVGDSGECNGCGQVGVASSGRPLGEGLDGPSFLPGRAAVLWLGAGGDASGSGQAAAKLEPVRSPSAPASAPKASDPVVGPEWQHDPWNPWGQPANGAQPSASGLAVSKPEPPRFPKVPNLAPEAEWDGLEEFGCVPYSGGEQLGVGFEVAQ